MEMENHGDEQVQVEKHFSHDHPLTRFSHPFIRTNAAKPLNCYICYHPIEEEEEEADGKGIPFYGCTDCDAFLHKSCLELPREYQSPCHPPHPLTRQFSGGQRFCWICCPPISGFAYGCSECDLYIDVRCHSFASSPEIAARKLEEGGHLFFLWKTEHGTHYGCDSCSQDDSDTYLFKCIKPSCPRSFHFRCAPFPLPETAKHDWHFHPLTLMDRYCWEEGYEVYYCDICEMERSLNHPVYACTECGFAAHITCTIFEGLPSIIADYERGTSKSKGISTHDVKLGNLSTEIQELQWEEDRLKYELHRVTEQIQKLEGVRAQYVALKTSELSVN